MARDDTMSAESSFEARPRYRLLVRQRFSGPALAIAIAATARELLGHALFSGDVSDDVPPLMNSGHPGSMTAIHADSPEAAAEQLVLLALESGIQLTWDNVRCGVTHTIDVFVQLGRSGARRTIDRVALPT